MKINNKGVTMTYEERLEELNKEQLELILLKLVDTDKEINIGNKTKNEIVKAHNKELGIF